MTRIEAIKTAISAERHRCALLLELTIKRLPPDQDAASVAALIRQSIWDIRVGKRPPERKRPTTNRVCRYCDGDEEPVGHNRATCKRRFADIAAGKVSS